MFIDIATERIESIQDPFRQRRAIEGTEARIQRFTLPRTTYRNAY